MISGKMIFGGIIIAFFIIMLIVLFINLINDNDTKGFWAGVICILHICVILALPIILS